MSRFRNERTYHRTKNDRTNMTRKSLATDIELTNSLAWFSCGAWLIVGMSTACRLRLHGKTDDIASCGNPSHSFHPGYEYKAASLISVTPAPPWGKVRATRLLSGSWLAPVNQPLDFIPCVVPTFGIPRIGVFIVELQFPRGFLTSIFAFTIALDASRGYCKHVQVVNNVKMLMEVEEN